MSYTNYAFYHFATIPNPEKTRDTLLSLCKEGAPELLGTVLVTPEGINAYYAGKPADVDLLLKGIQSIEGFADVEPKVSVSELNPFRKLVIKCKAETIGLGVEDLNPAEQTGKYVSPLEFKKWMDENPDDFVLVDTRNDYEVGIGTFKNAIDPKLRTFKDFPKWLEDNLADKKDKKIVTFCTGGIRCEKATAHMVREGYKDVYQIDGGILKYLEETQDTKENNHWNGDCFVFDYRVAVGKDLKPTDKTVCFACWSVLTPEDVESPKYKQGDSCPHCFEKQQAKRQALEDIGAEKRRVLLETRKAYGRKMKKIYDEQKSATS